MYDIVMAGRKRGVGYQSTTRGDGSSILLISCLKLCMSACARERHYEVKYYMQYAHSIPFNQTYKYVLLV